MRQGALEMVVKVDMEFEMIRKACDGEEEKLGLILGIGTRLGFW